MSEAGRWNITIDQGATWVVDFQLLQQDGVTPVNLTGSRIDMEIRDKPAGNLAFTLSTATSGIAFTDAVNGKFRSTATAAQTAFSGTTYATDVKVTYVDTTVEYWVVITITVRPRVTQ